MPRSLRFEFTLLAAALAAACAAASCSEDGVTTACPPLPLYQTFELGDASIPDAQSGDGSAAREALAAAVNAKCVTAPSSGIIGVGGEGGASGEPGASGGSASGGSASGGQTGGAGEGDNTAGAAGGD